MKKILLLSGAALMLGSVGNTMARQNMLDDLNNVCSDTIGVITDCGFCHGTTYQEPTPEKDQYLTEGACGFCTEDPDCIATPPTDPPTEADLIAEGRSVTNEYFANLFRLFGQHIQQTAQETGIDPTDPAIFTAVFPQCPDIAPLAGSEVSKKYGYLVRRVTTKNRNSRNIPDDWELAQLMNFEALAAKGSPRTEFAVTDENGTILNKPNGQPFITNEYEAFDFVKEVGGKGKVRVANTYFRYIRSITMPPPANVSGLPCLKCHGNDADLAPGVVEAIGIEYPYDKALGYSPGQIRGAWTIKIPVDVTP